MWCSAKVDSRQAGTAYFLIATFTRAAHRADGSGSIIPRRCGRTLPSAYGATNRVHSHCIGMDGVSHHCVDDLVGPSAIWASQEPRYREGFNHLALRRAGPVLGRMLIPLDVRGPHAEQDPCGLAVDS
jgi:hypothetical protein